MTNIVFLQSSNHRHGDPLLENIIVTNLIRLQRANIAFEIDDAE